MDDLLDLTIILYAIFQSLVRLPTNAYVTEIVSYITKLAYDNIIVVWVTCIPLERE